MAIILIVVILLVGARKLPELARNAGKAARILKGEAKAMKTDGTPERQATYQVTDNRPPSRSGTAGDQPGERPEASPGPATGDTRP